jgi:glycosyltransferase involved in cell wall biosynthesis/GT2 family glycosyltransferase
MLRHNRRVEVRWIQPGASVGAARGEIVVCVPVYGAHEHFVRCIESVLAHTSSAVPILVCDDASPDGRSEDLVRRLARESDSGHRLFYLRRGENAGFPLNVNSGFASADPADVAIVNSDVVVAEGWLEGLRAAAYSDSRVATATALTNHGSIVSVPERHPVPRLPQEWTIDDAAAAVMARSPRIRPRLPTAVGHCLYVRRGALELVGDFDVAFTPGYGEEVDFSQRCRRSGLCHVLADDVLVLHHGGGSFAAGGRRSPIQDAHELMIGVRYPYYHDEVRALEQDVSGPLARSLSAARRALKGLSVVIDARILSGPMTGTQLQVLEVVAALSRTGRPRLTALVPEDLSHYAAVALQAMPGVRVLTRQEAAVGGLERADVVHRPYQVNNDEDLSFLASLGERLIVTNQDLIGYHNPSYFRSGAAWLTYRRVTQSALALADHVVFISEHARDDALAEDLVEPGRASAVHNGVNHALSASPPAPLVPRQAQRLPADAEVIFCIGTDFRHKNRVFALAVLDELRRRHDWNGYVVLAGPTVAFGSSAPDEAEMLALRPGLSERVIDVAAISEAEKAWCYERAAVVLYPTVHEGFGLIPFEAADHDVPCMWAAGTSLGEVLPETAATIIQWNAADTAERVLELLRDAGARERNVAAIRAAGQRLTWDAAAVRLLDIYEETCNAPAAPASSVQRRDGLMQGGFSEDAVRLVGPSGALPPEATRSLLALATHPQFGKPMFGAIKLGYRASYRLRRLRENSASPSAGD